ncbi:MAG: methylenetetrahydrofolate reductase [Lachnospiraceae bacterium]|nr:methylenetetrahydrofolate reductase [NAD(P)H] [Lachnospiraceae bacterium]
MFISELFKKERPAFTFEVFPPKKTSPIESIYGTLDELAKLNPDFISVTYGAGGSYADSKTCKIASDIQEKYHIMSAAHLSCIYNSKEEIDLILEDLKQHGIHNILALRGDENPDFPIKTDFRHASDLIEYIREVSGDTFHISGACYPEGHLEAESLEEDVRNLKRKVMAGATHLISQLFFDNSYFYNFQDKAGMIGINVPIEAGIMPVSNKSQIEKMVSICGASIPAKLNTILQKYGDRPEDLREAGIEYAIGQIEDLLDKGVDGIHLYTMNNPYIAGRITEVVRQMI